MSELSLSTSLDRILELKDEVEKQKVELTPEVRAYIQTNLERVQEKLRKREAVTEDDMKFIDEVMMWVEMPEEWRKMAPSIKFMNLSDEMHEAKKRSISLLQWENLLHLAEVLNEPKGWIDEQFRFPGRKKIEAIGFLRFENCPTLLRLPQNLTVSDGMSLRDCDSLRSLPENLQVSTLNIDACPSLALISRGLKINDQLYISGCNVLRKLPDHLKVKGDLSIRDCQVLSHLPEYLDVGRHLILKNCPSITELPKNLKIPGSLELVGTTTNVVHFPEELEVGVNLYLSINVSSVIKAEAEKLKQRAALRGDIIFE